MSARFPNSDQIEPECGDKTVFRDFSQKLER